MFWRWAKHIGLLQTAPHYPIPVELSIGLLMEFSTDIPAKNCELHGGWYGTCNRTSKLWSFDCMICAFLSSTVMAWGGVVVLSGIGENAGMRMFNICTAPIIVWDQDKLQCSVSTGDSSCRLGGTVSLDQAFCGCTRNQVCISIWEDLHV